MKKLIASLLVMAGTAAQLLAAPTQIRIEIRYENVDAKWLPDMAKKYSKASLEKEGVIFSVPDVTVRGGRAATVELVREYYTRPEGPVVPCGIMIDLTADSAEGRIHISGKSLFRRPTDKHSEDVASRFETQEVWVDLVLEDGISKTVDMDNGGKMLITATLLDATGQPIKK